VVNGSRQISVTTITSGFVLSIVFSILSCFFLKDWQLMFRMRRAEEGFCIFHRLLVVFLTLWCSGVYQFDVAIDIWTRYTGAAD